MPQRQLSNTISGAVLFQWRQFHARHHIVMAVAGKAVDFCFGRKGCYVDKETIYCLISLSAARWRQAGDKRILAIAPCHIQE